MRDFLYERGWESGTFLNQWTTNTESPSGIPRSRRMREGLTFLSINKSWMLVAYMQGNSFIPLFQRNMMGAETAKILCTIFMHAKIICTISTFSAVKYEWWINERFNLGNFAWIYLLYFEFNYTTSIIFSKLQISFHKPYWFFI